MKMFWAISACLLSLACTSPAVIPTRVEGDFHLTQVKGSTVALWPVLAADMDDSLSKTVAGEYPSQDKFLDALSGRLSTSLTDQVQPALVKPEAIIAAFKEKELRDLLDPSAALNAAGTESRFGLSNEALSAFTTRLKAQALLKDVQYAIVPARVLMGRRVTQSTGGGGVYTGGPGGGAFVGGGSSSASSSARLRIVILDLRLGKIVWDGQIAAVASSSFMRATALHELEADLAKHLANAFLGIEDLVSNTE